jgi:hypothetical protein
MSISEDIRATVQAALDSLFERITKDLSTEAKTKVRREFQNALLATQLCAWLEALDADMRPAAVASMNRHLSAAIGYRLVPEQ